MVIYCSACGGNDTLTNNLVFGFDYVRDVRAFQFGGAGGDNLRVDIGTASSYPGTVLDGGDGYDTIKVYAYLRDSNPRKGAVIENCATGGTGNDTMSTGDGIDLVVFGSNSGADVLTQFCLYCDKIVFEDGQGFASLQQGAAGTTVLFTDGSSVLMQGQHFTDTMAIFS